MKNIFKWLFGSSNDSIPSAVDAQPSCTPLEARVSIEAKEIDRLIAYLIKVRENLDYKKIVAAADIKVASQEALAAAKHAKMLVSLKKSTCNIDSYVNDFIRAVTNAGQNGYYGAYVCMDVCTGIVDKDFYLNSSCFEPEDYYRNLLNTVYLYVAIKILQRKGYKFRRNKHEFFITTNEDVADAVKVNPKALDSLNTSVEIEPLLKEYEENAKTLYAEFPELFSDVIKKEFPNLDQPKE